MVDKDVVDNGDLGGLFGSSATGRQREFGFAGTALTGGAPHDGPGFPSRRTHPNRETRRLPFAELASNVSSGHGVPVFHSYNMRYILGSDAIFLTIRMATHMRSDILPYCISRVYGNILRYHRVILCIIRLIVFL